MLFRSSIQKDMEIVSSCVKAPADTMALLALAYDLSYPGISCVIPGAKNVEQVEKNAAASGIRLDQETMERLMATEGFVF